MTEQEKKLFKALGEVLTELDIYASTLEDDKKIQYLYDDITTLRRNLLG